MSLRTNAELVARQSSTIKDENMEAEEAAVLETVTRKLEKLQQTEKT